MMRECQRIADENHKNFNKIPQLLQVWEAVRICEENQPFTYADLAKITGLSYKQIRDVKRLLEQNDAFITNRAGSYFKCLGIILPEANIYNNSIQELRSDIFTKIIFLNYEIIVNTNLH